MKDVLLYVVTVLIWGSTWIAIEFQLGVVDPFVSVAYRFFLAAVVMFVICGLTGRLRQRFTLKEHGYAVLLGAFLFCLNYWLVYQGTVYLTSGLVALCFSTMTIMNIINQAVFFNVPIDRRIVVGTLLGLVGIVLVFSPEIEVMSLADKAMIGLVLCVSSSYSASLGNIVSLRNTKAGMPIMLTNAYGMLYGAVLAGGLSLLMGKAFVFDFSASYVMSLVYLAVFGSSMAFTVYLTLMSRIGADKASYVAVLVPVVALVISTFVEGYVWSLAAVAGTGLVLAGNVLAMTKGKPFAHLRRRGWRLFKQDSS